MANPIISFFADNAVTIFKGIMDEIKLSPEAKVQYEQKLLELQQAAQQADNDLEVKMNDIAGQNIRQETSSGDAFVRRARPAFLWAMTGALSLNIFIPLVNQCFGGHLQPIAIDAGLYGLFSSGFLGYTIARSYEKKQGIA